MSHIFDALQRSERESSGDGVSAPSETTEFLQRAERRAAWRWETTSLQDHPVPTVSAEQGMSPELEAVQSGAVAVETEERDSLLSIDESPDMFGQFESLQVAPLPENHLVCLTDNDSQAVEGFRLLGVRLRHLRRNRVLRRVLITSTIPQEGKSMVAANLACVLSQRTGHKVLLVEGDIRRPTFSRMLGIATNPGLCEYLAGERPLTKSIYYLEKPGLWIMPAGIASSNTQEPLQSARLSVLMDKLTTCFEWIIIDSPPVLPLADTTVWMRLADGILLVTRQGITKKRSLQRGLEAIEPHKLVGAVLNSSTSSGDSSYYYGRPSATPPDDQSAD
jgi:capsular exopolysaccharide synthesis family protein